MNDAGYSISDFRLIPFVIAPVLHSLARRGKAACQPWRSRGIWIRIDNPLDCRSRLCLLRNDKRKHKRDLLNYYHCGTTATDHYLVILDRASCIMYPGSCIVFTPYPELISCSISSINAFSSTMGLVTYPLNPASINRCRSVDIACAVRAIAGIFSKALMRRIFPKRVTPSMPGRLMSRRKISGATASVLSR